MPVGVVRVGAYRAENEFFGDASLCALVALARFCLLGSLRECCHVLVGDVFRTWNIVLACGLRLVCAMVRGVRVRGVREVVGKGGVWVHSR